MKGPARAATLAGGAVVLAAALPAVVGALLPENHVAVRSEWFPLPPAQVWPLVLEEFERRNDGTYAIAERAEPHRLVTELAPGKGPFDGTWTYELAPAGSGTSLRITERGAVHPPFFRFVSRFVIGHTRSLDEFLAALRNKAG